MKYLAVLLLMLSACNKRIVRPSVDVSFNNGKLIHQGRNFSGVVEENFVQTGTVRDTQYYKGVPHGEQLEYLPNSSQIVALRNFSGGKNSGVHKGWFADGHRRFHYEYKEGLPHGEFWEWHNSGHPSLFARFDKGVLIGKKMWREDGKIYMNFVFPQGKAVGVPGVKLCYQVRDGGGAVLK